MTSIYYQSPNRLLDKELNEDDDLWSFAMLLFYLTDHLPSDSKSIKNMYRFTKKLSNKNIDPTSDIFINLTAYDIVTEIDNKKNQQLNEKSINNVEYLINRFNSIYYL